MVEYEKLGFFFLYNVFTQKEQCRYKSPREEARDAHGWSAVKRRNKYTVGCVIIPC